MERVFAYLPLDVEVSMSQCVINRDWSVSRGSFYLLVFTRLTLILGSSDNMRTSR